MPNQRAADKKAVSTWIPNDLKNALVRIAEDRGQTLAAYVQSLYEDAVAKQSKRVAAKAAAAPKAKARTVAKTAPARKKPAASMSGKRRTGRG